MHRKLKTYNKLYLCFHYVLDSWLTVFQVHLVLRTGRELWTEGIVEGKSVREITQPSAVRLRDPLTHHDILEKRFIIVRTVWTKCWFTCCLSWSKEWSQEIGISEQQLKECLHVSAVYIVDYSTTNVLWTIARHFTCKNKDTSLVHTRTHSLTHSPHSSTHSLTHPLTHSLTDSLTHSLTHSLTDLIKGACFKLIRASIAVSAEWFQLLCLALRWLLWSWVGCNGGMGRRITLETEENRKQAIILIVVWKPE